VLGITVRVMTAGGTNNIFCCMVNNAVHYKKVMTAVGTKNIFCGMMKSTAHYTNGDDSWGN
jgi:hypothetical protein